MVKKKSASTTSGAFNSFGAFRTWIEISRSAAEHNYRIFRALINPETKLWAVVKSNAYGHGLLVFSKLIDKIGIDGFCVDSLLEGLKLRKEGIKKSILVLGPTLQNISDLAKKENITITVSSFDALRAIGQMKSPPNFHLKIDTGMHRQGFFMKDIPRIIRFLNDKRFALHDSLNGIYTHFASAKDTNYPTYTDLQFNQFSKAVKIFETAGFKNLIKHVSATGGVMIDPKYHLNAVRVGIGLYGLWPAKELEIQLGSQINLEPILNWKTIISEIKNISSGQFVGYDLVERVLRPSKIAVLPIGYWHGLSRALSGVGEILINGRRAKILGRVSMDLVVVDVTGIKCGVGDSAILIGKDRNQKITAFELGQKSNTSHYEFVTRLNPLMERIIIS